MPNGWWGKELTRAPYHTDPCNVILFMIYRVISIQHDQTTNHCKGSVTYLSRSSFSESIPNRDWLCTRQLESIFTQHFQTYWQPFYSDDCTDIKALFKKLSASPHKHFKRGSMKYIHTTKYWWLELKSYIFQNTGQLLHFTCFGFISGTTSGFYNDGRWHSE